MWAALGLWAAAATAITLAVGGVAFTAVFCGTDWDTACTQNSGTGWIVIVLSTALTVAAALPLRRPAVTGVAIASIPLQLWFYIAWAIPTAATSI
ncbi:hypothetical protein [Candidatus Poriferisodalis sp.]|uniref:hypothetical protein n=1 Tax=Candidatus Poriferisodalis sp. TaxID=3101277 RepID=UPI003B0247C9